MTINVRQELKDRPFTEGSRGCHVLLGLDAQNLNAKERHFILPLVIWTFIMQSVAFISSTSQDRIKLIFSALISHAYLKSNFYCLQHDNLLEGSYSIHRQVWWTLMAKTGFKDTWKHKQYLYLVLGILAIMRGKGKVNMFE